MTSVVYVVSLIATLILVSPMLREIQECYHDGNQSMSMISKASYLGFLKPNKFHNSESKRTTSKRP